MLCAAPDAATKYRVRFDHTAPFFDDADRNGDGVVDASDFCATTSDSGMMRKGTKNTGPGTITVAGSIIHYSVSLAELNPALTEGDTVFIWADTQAKGIVDRAPDTDASDGCADPELDTEVLDLPLGPGTCSVAGGSCLVFATSTQHTGNLGGLAGADAICQARAGAVGLGGTFRAWLSDTTTAARDRLTQASVPYVRVDGIQVADDFSDLVDGTIAAPISVDEFRNEVSGRVWTGATSDGTTAAAHCDDWTSGAFTLGGTFGASTRTDGLWTDSTNGAVCSEIHRQYCFEQ